MPALVREAGAAAVRDARRRIALGLAGTSLLLCLVAPAASAGPPPAEPSYLKEQWNLRITRTVGAWGLTRGAGPGATSPVVGVVDSGVDAKHPELTDRTIKGRNTAADSDDTADRDGHGTFVAGVVAAQGVSMFGVAPEARIMPLKVQQQARLFYPDDDIGLPVARAIRFGLQNGVRIFNISLGTTATSPEMRRAVEQAWTEGTLVFVSAGNTGQNWTAGEPAPRYPASYPQAIAISATTRTDRVAGYSNTGAHVRLSAPGGDPSGAIGNGSANLRAELILGPALGKDGYEWSAGTSFAAPHAAGTAALVWSINPNLTNEQVARILFETADRPGNFSGRSNGYGYGRVNALRAVVAALPEPFALALDAPRPGCQVTGEIEVSGWAGEVRGDGLNPADSVEVYLGDDASTGRLLAVVTPGLPSTELAEVLGSERLANHGFRSRVDLSDLPPGPATLTVVARGRDGATAQRSVSVEIGRRP